MWWWFFATTLESGSYYCWICDPASLLLQLASCQSLARFVNWPHTHTLVLLRCRTLRSKIDIERAPKISFLLDALAGSNALRALGVCSLQGMNVGSPKELWSARVSNVVNLARFSCMRLEIRWQHRFQCRCLDLVWDARPVSCCISSLLVGSDRIHPFFYCLRQRF